MHRTGTVRLAAAVVATFGLAIAAPAAAFAAPVHASAETTVSVTPNVDLVDGDEVAVSVNGFAGEQSVITTQCRVTGDETLCNWDGAIEVEVDANGAGLTPFTVQRSFVDDGRTVDCAAAAGCYIFAFDAAESSVAVAPIAFRPVG